MQRALEDQHHKANETPPTSYNGDADKNAQLAHRKVTMNDVATTLRNKKEKEY